MAVWGLSLRVGIAWSMVVALGSSGDLSAQANGHRVSGNQVIVETQRHWENWDFPLGTLEIENGSVQPQRLQRNTNAVVDIVDFLRINTPDNIKKEPEDITQADAVQAGSN